MIVLGLHFGHDAAACVVKRGRILSYVSREREQRVKHAIGLTAREVDGALARAGVSMSEIDCVALISTQNLEILTGLIEGFGIALERHPADRVPSSFADSLAHHQVPVERYLKFALAKIFTAANAGDFHTQFYGALCPEKDLIARGALASAGWIDTFISTPEWENGATLAEIASFDCSARLASQDFRYGFHYPVTVTLKGRILPGYYVNHHVAHAASSFYTSGFEDAAIVTHDGFGNGEGYHSGLILHGRGNHIVPAGPHHLAIGGIYDRVGLALNLGPIGPAGKLMGLAPYGEPAFFDRAYVGNWYDVKKNFAQEPGKAWLKHCSRKARELGYDMSPLAMRDRATEKVNADIAASTQKLFEESYLAAIRSAFEMLRNSGVETSRLCLTGGTALNCPTNTRVYAEGPFTELHIEPHCSDDGLAIGGALYVYHHLYGESRPQDAPAFASPYLGRTYDARACEEALAQSADLLRFEKVADAPAQAARDIHAGKVIAWFEGGSEVGPRALGHRSLLASPVVKETWDRVNKLKKREWWRPFAPSVLASEAGRWFAGLPAQSPYMLFTAAVTSDKLPAITHVDGSARVQTVDENAGDFHAVIKAYHALSGIPVVLNTSFNGPREPIVETPGQAIAFLLATELDALYLQGYRVTRR